MQSEEEPGPSSAIYKKDTNSDVPQKTSKSQTLSSPLKPKSSQIITEMKQVSPSSSKSATPSSSTSFVVSDGKKVVYSIFPPIHDQVLFGLTKRQLLTLITLALTELFCGQVYSIQGPFYPEEARQKLFPNFTYTQIGSVFGIFELAICVFIPIFGKMMQNDGTPPKLLFHCGVFITAMSTLMFAFVELIPNQLMFLIFSLVLRAVQGIGEAATLSSACALLTIEFGQGSVATTFTSMETFYSFGIITGPVVGGTLMDIYDPEATGKFALTFFCIGFLLLGTAIVGLFILPPHDYPEGFHELDGKCCFNNGGFNVFNLFKAPSIPLVALTILSGGSTIGFVNAMLEPHIHEFLIGKSYTLLGAFFIISGGICGLLSPGYNWIMGQIKRSFRYFVIFGSILIIAGFILLGPSSYVPLEKSLVLAGFGLCLQGIGLGAITVGSFRLLLDEAIKAGYANNINSYGLVSTFWTLTFSFGCFLGSSTSGILYEEVGFSNATWVWIGLHTIVIILNSISILVNWKLRRMNQKRNSIIVEQNREDEPLLNSDSFYKSSKIRSYT